MQAVKTFMHWDWLGPKMPLWARTVVRWTLWAAGKAADAGAWTLDKALSMIVAVVQPFARKVVELGLKYGGSFKGYEAGELPRLVERLAKAGEEVRRRAAPQGVPIPDADEVAESITMLLFKMVGTVVTVLAVMLCLAAALWLGWTLLVIIGLFFALSIFKKQFKGTHAAVISAVEQQLGDFAKAVYGAVAGAAEQVPDFWRNAAGAVSLENVYDKCLPSEDGFDQKLASELEGAYSKSASRLVPGEWRTSADYVRQQELAEAKRFMDQSWIEDWMEWASAALKFAVKCGQAFYWWKSVFFNLRAKRFLAGLLAVTLGSSAFPEKVQAHLNRAVKAEKEFVEFGGVIEKWANLADLVLIWLPILLGEIMWLVSREPSAAARVQGLYEIRTT